MLNHRFGEEEFAGPKRRLQFFLFVFSISFFIRGTYDLVTQLKTPKTTDKNWSAVAGMMFTLYFLTEWLPIFVIYLTHLWAFHSLLKRRRLKAHEQT